MRQTGARCNNNRTNDFSVNLVVRFPYCCIKNHSSNCTIWCIFTTASDHTQVQHCVCNKKTTLHLGKHILRHLDFPVFKNSNMILYFPRCGSDRNPLWKDKWLRGGNYVNIQGMIMVLVHCPSSYCNLSIHQFSFQSLLYFQRYGQDRYALWKKMVMGR